MFQDLGSAQATMEASKVADFYGRALGNVIKTADAEQAYVQAPMTGVPTWICCGLYVVSQNEVACMSSYTRFIWPS